MLKKVYEVYRKYLQVNPVYSLYKNLDHITIGQCYMTRQLVNYIIFNIFICYHFLV